MDPNLIRLADLFPGRRISEGELDVARRALDRVAPGRNLELWATLQLRIADELRARRDPARPDHLSEAIIRYERLEQLVTPQHPDLWVQVRLKLGLAYLTRRGGARRDDIERGLVRLTEVLPLVHDSLPPEELRQLRTSLAWAYLHREIGARTENLRHVEEYCRLVLSTRPPTSPDQMGASAHLMTALATLERVADTPVPAPREAIHHLEAAIDATSPDVGGGQVWARAQAELAKALERRAEEAWGPDLDAALQHYRSAMSVFTLDAFPNEFQRLARRVRHVEDRMPRVAATPPAPQEPTPPRTRSLHKKLARTRRAPKPQPRPHDAPDPVASRRERVVSTGFAEDTPALTVREPSMPLAAGRRYHFWFEVGPAVIGSIEQAPVPLPFELLPVEAELDVVLFSFDRELVLTPRAESGRLELLADGTVRVEQQPGHGDGLPVGAHPGPHRLYFPVRTPGRPGVHRLRCSVYHRGVLIQSRVVSARVLARPTARNGALRSVVDYTLSPSVDAAHLHRIPEHGLSLLLNDNGDGTCGVRVLAGGGVKIDNTVSAHALQDVIEQARGAMRRTAWGDEGEWDGKRPYRYASMPDLDDFRRDLVQCAVRGYTIYDAVINDLTGDYEQLAEHMRTPRNVQIANKQSPSHILPAAMIYDYLAFNPDADLPMSQFQLCEAFLDALDSPQPLEEQPCFKGDCPSRELETVVCPSGFWGFRHRIGMPISVGEAPDTPVEIQVDDQLDLMVAVSTDPGFVLRSEHEKRLHGLLPNLNWLHADTRAATLELLRTAKPHLVYFYCHGGMANDTPYIQVGQPDARGITRRFLRGRVRWDRPRPLVFINGCHTTAIQPEQAIEFVSAFVENSQAAGVIGTEITIFEPLACEFAEQCLRQFLVVGVPIGEAVRRARLALLKMRNPLGLVYIPFIMATVALVRASGT